MKYKVIVDYGKPFQEEFKTEKEVIDFLQNLKEKYEENIEQYPYFDINILKDNKDITDDFLKTNISFFN